MTPNPTPMHTEKPGFSTLFVKSGVQNRWELQLRSIFWVIETTRTPRSAPIGEQIDAVFDSTRDLVVLEVPKIRQLEVG